MDIRIIKGEKMKDIKKYIVKIGFCAFAWVVLLFMFNFVAGNNEWLTGNDVFPRFGYLMMGAFSNVLIVGGEYL
jgi:hypothetical protein